MNDDALLLTERGGGKILVLIAKGFLRERRGLHAERRRQYVVTSLCRNVDSATIRVNTNLYFSITKNAK